MTEAASQGSLPAGRPGPLAWSVVGDRAGLQTLEPDWRRLAGPYRFFVGPDWVLAWLEGRGGEGVSPHVLVARDGAGALVGLLPLVRTARGDLEPAGRLDGVAHVDVVAQAGREDEVAAGAIERLLGHQGGRVRLARLSESGALARAVHAREADVQLLSRPSAVCPFAALPSGWEGFLESLDKHYRQDARRQARRFFGRESAQARWAETVADVPAALDTLFDLHGRRFQSLRRASDFLGQERHRFHATLATRLAARGDLALGTLLDGGKPVASAYGFHHGGITHLFNTGLHPEFTSLGVGLVQRALFVTRAGERGPGAEIDFLDGCYEWKIRWATGVRVLLDVDLFPMTALGGGSRLLAGAVRAARSRAATFVKGRRCPGRPDGAIAASPDRCRKVGCPYPPEEERPA